MNENRNLCEAAAAPDPVRVEPWDAQRFCAPDPSLPPAEQLHWYKIFAHVLLLNCSERCRRAAVRSAQREMGLPQ